MEASSLQDAFSSSAFFIYGFLAFFIGSVPFGLLISKLCGVDIRSVGSGNIGATNVYRTLGKIPGLLTFILDLTKGVIAILLTSTSDTLQSLPPEQYQPFIGMCAILGHCYSPFLHGKGGKGVATSFGVFLYLLPLQASLAFTVFLICFYVTRYVSLSSLLSTASIILLVVYTHSIYSLMFVALFIVSTVIVIRHRENIRRLIAGEENRFSSRTTV